MNPGHIERGAIEPDLEVKEAEFDPRESKIGDHTFMLFETGGVGMYSPHSAIYLTDDEAIALKKWLNENF